MQKLEDFIEDVPNYIDFIKEFTHTLEDDMTYMRTNRNYNEILFDTNYKTRILIFQVTLKYFHNHLYIHQMPHLHILV